MSRQWGAPRLPGLPGMLGKDVTAMTQAVASNFSNQRVGSAKDVTETTPHWCAIRVHQSANAPLRLEGTGFRGKMVEDALSENHLGDRAKTTGRRANGCPVTRPHDSYCRVPL